jgi:hypothetical protein
MWTKHVKTIKHEEQTNTYGERETSRPASGHLTSVKRGNFRPKTRWAGNATELAEVSRNRIVGKVRNKGVVRAYGSISTPTINVKAIEIDRSGFTFTCQVLRKVIWEAGS